MSCFAGTGLQRPHCLLPFAVDATASFTASRRPPSPPPATPRQPEEEWTIEDADEQERPEPINAIPPESTTASDNASIAPKNSAELDDLLNLESAGGDAR